MIDKIITVIVALVSVYIGYLLSSRTAKKTIKLQEFNRAASDFYAAFIEAQRRLDKSRITSITPTNSEGVRNILLKFIDRQERAMIKFRPYLEKSKIPSFNDAWKTYHSKKDNSCKFLIDYISKFHNKTKDPEHEEKIRELALSRIETLLSFTEIKNT